MKLLVAALLFIAFVAAYNNTGNAEITVVILPPAPAPTPAAGHAIPASIPEVLPPSSTPTSVPTMLVNRIINDNNVASALFTDTSTTFTLTYTAPSTGFTGKLTYRLPLNYADYAAGKITITPEPTSVTVWSLIVSWLVSVKPNETFTAIITIDKKLEENILDDIQVSTLFPSPTSSVHKPAAMPAVPELLLSITAPPEITSCQTPVVKISIENKGSPVNGLQITAPGFEKIVSLGSGERADYYYVAPNLVLNAAAFFKGQVVANAYATIIHNNDGTLCVGKAAIPSSDSYLGTKLLAELPINAKMGAGEMAEIEVTLGEKNIFADIIDDYNPAGGVYAQAVKVYEPGMYRVVKRLRGDGLRVISETNAYQLVYDPTKDFNNLMP